MEIAGQITLLLHFIGMGLFVAIQVAGMVVGKQYKKAQNLQEKATLLKVMRPIGLLSPIAVLLMIISGVGNMHTFQITLADFGWLQLKIVVFAIAAIIGIFIGIISKKRGMLVGMMLQGKAPADAEKTLRKYDGQVALFTMITPILLLVILCLSVYGRLGGQ